MRWNLSCFGHGYSYQTARRWVNGSVQASSQNTNHHHHHHHCHQHILRFRWGDSRLNTSGRRSCRFRNLSIQFGDTTHDRTRLCSVLLYRHCVSILNAGHHSGLIDMDRKRTWPLLPAPQTPAPGSSKASSSTTVPKAKKQRTNLTKVACESCRTRRSAVSLMPYRSFLDRLLRLVNRQISPPVRR